MTAPDRESRCTLTVSMPVGQCTPRIRISGRSARHVLGTGPDWHEPGADLSGGRFVIHAAGGRVVYRVGAYHPEDDTYDAEWPD